MGFRDFRVFFFGYRAQNENPETTENQFLGYKFEIQVDLFYDHHFNFLMTYPLVHGILTGHDFPTHKSGWNRMKMKYRRHPLDLGHPISKEAPAPLQILTNQLKRKIILGWLLYVLRSFLQVGFRFHYQLINLVWLSTDLSSFITIYFLVALHS